MTETRGDIRLSCQSSEHGVRALLARLMPMLPGWGIPDEDAMTIELVLAETLNNIAEHAFPTEDDAFIAVHLWVVGNQFHVKVRDAGLPMPGLTLPSGTLPNPDVARADLPEGGFGWFLIRSQTDALEYRREGAGNHLSYSIRLSLPAQPKRDYCRESQSNAPI
ncbi:MAG: ATP-binding protein [Pseudomonadota bacterium]